MLTTCVLLFSTVTWAQEAEEPAPVDDDAPASEAPPAESAPGANPPPWEAGGPAHAPAPEAALPPPIRRSQQRHGSQRHKMPRCESWELAVWNPRKSGCAAQPDALGDEWCPVPEGMTPVQPVGDANKWWVKRCTDEPADEPLPPPGG